MARLASGAESQNPTAIAIFNSQPANQKEITLSNNSLQSSVLYRLLTLNSDIHDLESQLRQEPVPRLRLEHHIRFETDKINSIAETQDAIDQNVRASLMTCWLGMPEE